MLSLRVLPKPIIRRRGWVMGFAKKTRLKTRFFLVAVGTRVTSRPPHGSVRAAFPHTALTLGLTATQLASRRSFPALGTRIFCCFHSCAALSPARVLLVRIPLGHRPWLHQLRRGSLRFVRRLQSYYGDVRLPALVHHRLRLLAFPMRTPVQDSTWAKRRISQLPVRSV